MRLVTYDQLRPLLELDHLDGDLLAEAFKLLNCGHHYIWVDANQIEERSSQYAIEQGWNPETTMVLYSPPTPVPTYQEMQKDMGITEPTPDDDFDIIIGTLNPTQTVCSLYPDMSAEKLADTINRVSRMRVFL